MTSPTYRPPIYQEIDGEDILEKEPYYFDDITIDKATEILYNLNKEGAFLVRKRSVGYSPSLPYSLSVFYDQRVHHTRIKCDKDGKYLTETKDQNPRKFSSISRLIKFLNEEAVLKLTTRYNNLIGIYKDNTKAIENTSFDTHDFESLSDQPYYLGNCKKEVVEKILSEIKQNEVFFIRNAMQSNPRTTPFEMLIYHKNCIYTLKISRSPYDAYSIETSDMHFETIPEMIKYYNYNKLKITSTVQFRLQIYSKYINI